jgi:hypothetical protein
MKRTTKECPKCKRQISASNFNKHVESCTGIVREKKEIEYIKLENELCKCKYCGKEYTFSGIGTHIWRNHGAGINFNPLSSYEPSERRSWNKGLTKETDDRVRQNGLSYTKLYKEGKIVSWCKGLAKETDDRIKYMSDNVSKTVNEKIKNDDWHVSFAHARIIEYKGIKFHGSWEVAFAKYLDENETKWRRPTEKFEYEFEGKKRYYTPDFYLIDEKKYIEIKGYPTDKDRAKWKFFPLDLQVIYGKELFALGLINSYKEIE